MKSNLRYFTYLLALLLTLILLVGCEKSPEQVQIKAMIGKPSPNFALTDLKGQEWKLSDFRGKVVFINFWATWCPPCLQELPSMNALHKQMEGVPFQMLTILYNDRPEMGQSLVNKSGYTFPVLIDPDGSVGKQYGLTGVPETFIVDTEGTLQEKFIGPYNWTSKSAVQRIEQYLPK